MSFTHVITRQWSSPNGTTLTNRISQTDGGEINEDFTLAYAAADVAIPVAFDSARVKSVFLLSTNDATLKTNNPSSPSDTITLSGGKAFTWVDGDPGTPPFGTDVTAFYASNDGSGTATVQIRILHDPTP